MFLRDNRAMPTAIPVFGPRRQNGFTLIELMIAIGVLAILIGIAASPLKDAIMNVRMSAITNDLMSDLALARSEAVKRGVPVRLCRSTGGVNCNGGAGNGDWSVGWIVFVDDSDNGTRNGAEIVLRARAAVAEGTTVNLTPADRDVPFRPTGVTNIVAVNETFRLCDERTTPHRGRKVEISSTGRAVATRCTCPGCP
jgi:type IV fimbrial biogenesis protein FimT